MPDIKAALTRKIGPLPAWAWGGIGAGAIWLWRAYSRRGLETGGESFTGIPGQSAITPVAVGGGPSPFSSAPFETVSGTQSGSISLGTAAGGYGTIEGPFDFIERVLTSPGFGGVLQPSAPIREIDGGMLIPNLPRAPAVAQPAPIRQPTPQPISFLPLTPESIRLLFRAYPGQFIGNPEYWVNSLLGIGIPGDTAARTWEWADFWGAYARAGLPR